jgi:hypothetical protein
MVKVYNMCDAVTASRTTLTHLVRRLLFPLAAVAISLGIGISLSALRHAQRELLHECCGEVCEVAHTRFTRTESRAQQRTRAHTHWACRRHQCARSVSHSQHLSAPVSWEAAAAGRCRPVGSGA